MLKDIPLRYNTAVVCETKIEV